jgi:hypothetical protein
MPARHANLEEIDSELAIASLLKELKAAQVQHRFVNLGGGKDFGYFKNVVKMPDGHHSYAVIYRLPDHTFHIKGEGSGNDMFDLVVNSSLVARSGSKAALAFMNAILPEVDPLLELQADIAAMAEAEATQVVA